MLEHCKRRDGLPPALSDSRYNFTLIKINDQLSAGENVFSGD